MNGGRNLLGFSPPFIITSTIRNQKYYLLKIKASPRQR